MVSRKTAGRIGLIDYLRGISILAVIASHIHSYRAVPYVNFTIFCIPLFIFLAGITFALSAGKKRHPPVSPEHYAAGQSLKITGLYALAVLLHVLYQQRYLEFAYWWESFWNFTIGKQFYFVPLYIQLLVISPFLIRLAKRPFLKQLVIIALLVMVGLAATKYTNMTNSLGGGRKLFGGNFLIVYYLGLLASPRVPVFLFWIQKPRHQFMLLAGAALLYVLFLLLHLDRHFIANPPVPGTLLFTAVVALGSVGIYGTLPRVIRRILSALGKYSLVIFLFHILALELLVRFFPPYFYCSAAWCAYPVYFITATVVPVAAYIMCRKFFIWLNGPALQ